MEGRNPNKVWIALIVMIQNTSLFAMDIQFTGFGTAAVGTVIGNNDEPYLVDPVSGGTYDDEIRFEPETLLALRAIAPINQDFNAVLQVTAKGAEHYDAFIEWAYIEYQFNPETSVSVGRYRLPLYFYSDFLDTGYAYHWIRPPTDLYSVPVSTLTGAHIRNSHYFGDLGVTTQVWYGAETDDAEEVIADITKSQGINVTFEYQWFQLRLVHHTLQLGIEVKPFLVETPGGLVLVTPDPFKDKVAFQAIAFMADLGAFTVRSEFTEVDNEALSDKEHSGYGSVGYRVGLFTPHYTYSFFDGVEEKQSHIVGVRWDFALNTSVKMEYINQHYETAGGDTLVGPIEANEYRTEVLSMALDFIF